MVLLIYHVIIFPALILTLRYAFQAERPPGSMLLIFFGSTLTYFFGLYWAWHYDDWRGGERRKGGAKQHAKELREFLGKIMILMIGTLLMDLAGCLP